MDKTILVRLGGQPTQYRLDEAAYDRLSGYLDRARRRLADDPERPEVLADLERSVGDRLAAVVGTDDRTVTAAEMDGILEAIGVVDTGTDAGPEPDDAKPRKRRLMRIREGQQVAGVCNGIATYSELGVDWVRTGFILGSLVTGGVLVVVYIALALILPVAPTRAAAR